jgi:hypothetical protein
MSSVERVFPGQSAWNELAQLIDEGKKRARIEHPNPAACPDRADLEEVVHFRLRDKEE